MARLMAMLRGSNIMSEGVALGLSEIDERMAAMPPLYQAQSRASNGGGSPYNTASTNAMLTSAQARGDPTSIEDMNRDFRITALRAVHGSWRIGYGTYRLFTSMDEETVALRRSLADPTRPRALLTALTSGVTGAFTVASEIFSGRAFANATANQAEEFGVSSVSNPGDLDFAARFPTKLKWEYVTPRRYRDPLAMAAAAEPNSSIAKYAAFRAANVETRFWNKFFGPEQTTFTARIRANMAGVRFLLSDWHAYSSANLPSVMARTTRLTTVLHYVGNVSAAVRAKYMPSTVAFNASAAPASNTSTSTSVFQATAVCLAPWESLCEGCLVLANYVGAFIGSFEAWADFYTCNGPGYADDLCELVAEYAAMRAYLIDDTLPVRFGGWDDLPAGFPSRNHSTLAYFDDPVPDKLHFDDAADLVDETVSYFLDLLTSFDFVDGGGSLPGLSAASASFASTSGYPVTLVGVDADGEPALINRTLYVGQDDALMAQLGMRPHLMSSSGFDPMQLIRTHAVRIGDVFGLRASLAEYARAQIAARASNVSTSTTGTPRITSLGSVAFEWIHYIYTRFFSCFSPDDVFATNQVRFSLFHAGVIMLAPAIPVALLLLAAPQMGVVVNFVAGSMGLMLYVYGTAALASGTSFGCFPRVAPVVWSVQLPYLVFRTLLPKQWFLGSGLIHQYDYDNTNAMNATLWAEGYFTMDNCYADLSWRNLFDFVVFPLRQWAPTWLAYWSDPENWPPPLDLLVGADIVQETLHRWDDVNMATDDVIYRANWTCWVIMGVACLLLLYFVLTLLRLAPITSSLTLISAILVLFIKIAAGFLFGIIVIFWQMLMAPIALQTLSRTLLQRRADLRRITRRLKAAVSAQD